MLSKNLENSPSYDIFINFGKKLEFTTAFLGGRTQAPPPPWIRHCCISAWNGLAKDIAEANTLDIFKSKLQN